MIDECETYYDSEDGITKYVPTPVELADELDKPHAPPTVIIGGWNYPAMLCRAPGCGRLVARHLGRMCEDCQDLYNDQR